MKKFIIANAWWITLVLGLIMLIAHTLSLNVIKVDNTSIILLIVIAISPFISAIKRIKYGEFEAEINPKEIEKIKKEVREQVKDDERNEKPPESVSHIRAIQGLVESEPILALAKLRIEIEKVLKKIFRITGLKNRQKRPMSAGQIAYSLAAAEIINKNIAQSIQEVISICNRALHGEDIRIQDAKSIVDVGTSLLSELDINADDLLLKPIESVEVSQDIVDEYLSAKYRVTTIIPLIEQPKKEIRILDQEGLDELLEGYNEYAEFIIEVNKINSSADE